MRIQTHGRYTDEDESYRLWSVASTVFARVDERSHSIIAIQLGNREYVRGTSHVCFFSISSIDRLE